MQGWEQRSMRFAKNHMAKNHMAKNHWEEPCVN